MTVSDALQIAQFLTTLGREIYMAAQTTPTGEEVNLDKLLVKSTTQKLRDAGVDPAEADRLEKPTEKDR